MTGMLVESASETLRCYAMMEADSESTVSPCWKKLRIILQNLAYKDVEVIVVTSQIENEIRYKLLNDYNIAEVVASHCWYYHHHSVPIVSLTQYHNLQSNVEL